uniref:Putative molecular chaperone sec63 endoplasmic reticulum translocon component n=1 Tax=Xenopsylla cheopis TaxID=163159 RepID=A0A6M2DBT9_XENCH
MAGQKFQYDESGTTFFYFLLSFLFLILVPATFYYWPKKKKESEEKSILCNCPDCISKRHYLARNQKPYAQILKRILIVTGWLALIYLTYKVSQFEHETIKFDPYDILGVPVGSSEATIKKAYRKLSVILHPDKETGDEKEFMKLTKAYQALTDAEARKNFEKYGNPDGPGVMSFGIALPSWIVQKENSIFVLGLYAAVFMVALPVAVCTWWYRTIKYSGDRVLLDTTQMYYYFLYRTPEMSLKRALMILGASLEFDKKHNSEVMERLSDNIEVRALIKLLPNLNEKNKEQPLCRLYSIKARALLHAHLSRMRLNPETLDLDRMLIVKKCPRLIEEMVCCVNQLIVLAYARRIQRLISIETLENCMKLSPMIVQGLWQFKNPFLQLPHIAEEHLKHFSKKKNSSSIKTLKQLAEMSNSERRKLLKSLSDCEYENVIRALGTMPLIDFSIQCEVVDDENPTVVTAGAIVTVTCTLIRHSLSEYFNQNDTNDCNDEKDDDNYADNTENPENEQGNQNNTAAQTQNKKPAWLKTKKSTSNKNKSNKNKFSNKANSNKVVLETKDTGHKDGSVKDEKHKDSNKEKDNDRDSVLDSDSEREDRSSDDEKDKKNTMNEDDDTEWNKFQERLQKRDKVLEGKSKISHSVHCPFFPEDKQEYWWVYICDRKSRSLLTAPYHVTNLVNREQIQLRFTAPRWAGVYTFNVCLRSDSYLGADQQLDMRLDVEEAVETPTQHPQWQALSDSSDSNADDDDGDDHSDLTTDSDNDDDIDDDNKLVAHDDSD